MSFDFLTSIISHLFSYIYFYMSNRRHSRIYCEYVYKIVEVSERIYIYIYIYNWIPTRLLTTYAY